MEETNAYIIQLPKKTKKKNKSLESKRQSIISLFPHLSQEMDHVFLVTQMSGNKKYSDCYHQNNGVEQILIS
jgi:hypothetical protein